jgi:hypothetical protein
LFASDFVQAMPIPLHAGAAWSDPVFQECRRAEIAAEQERMARHHAQAEREQTERQNAEERALRGASAWLNDREDRSTGEKEFRAVRRRF